MNILIKRLKQSFPDNTFTYGNMTAADRKALRLDKSHANDSVAIALFGLPILDIDDTETVYVQQQRKKKRSLHEANPRKGRSEPNRKAKRNVKNIKSVTTKKGTYYLLDKVVINGREGWITGFTGTSAYVKDINDDYITTSPKYNQVSLSKMKVLSHNNNWLIGPVTHLGKD